MRTRAIREGDRYTISGSKLFITNGSVADVYVVMAVTDSAAGRGGISAFVMDRGTPGLSNGRKIEKLGLRASDTAEVILDNVTVPARNLIGKVGGRLQQTLKILEGGRIGIAGLRSVSRAALSKMRSPTPRSANSSAVRSLTCRQFSGCWPTWRRESRRRGCCSIGRRP